MYEDMEVAKENGIRDAERHGSVGRLNLGTFVSLDKDIYIYIHNCPKWSSFHIGT